MKYCTLFIYISFFIFFHSNPPSYSKTEEIKIGLLVPLTGPLSKIAVTHVKGHTFAVQEINKKGGITSLGGARLKLVVADTKGDPIIGIQEMHKLAKEGILAVFGTYQSSVVLPTSELGEKLRIPYIVTTALSDRITQRGLKYVFRPEARISDFIRDEFSFIQYLQHRYSNDIKIALLYEDSLFGQFSAITQRKYARKFKINIETEISYPAQADDLSQYVLKLKDTVPDIVLQTSYLLDAIRIGNLVHKYKIKSLFLATGAGPKDPEFVRSLGRKSNFWLVINEWNRDMKKSGVIELNKKFRRKYGTDMDGIVAMSYISTWILKEAIEKAGSRNREDIRNALATIYIDTGPTSTLPLGFVAFDENGQNKFVNLITQIINGKHYTVWPPELSSQAMQWPN